MSAYRQKCRKRKIDDSIEITANQSNESNNIDGDNNQNARLSNVRRLSNLDVSKFLEKHNVRTETDLFILATEQQQAGKEDLYNFVINRSPKSLQDLMMTTWKMQDAKASLARRNTPRMDMIRQEAANECVDGCGGEWLESALQVLQNNGLHPIVFADAMRDLLVNRRGKHRNIFIAGPADCAKTFILAPLVKIFNTFSNPSDNKYSWLGVEDAEAIFLNDFRWSPESIAWKELLLLLEGQTVHLPTPKNMYARDICISRDTPIFAIGKAEIKYIGKFNTTDDIENEMMSVRWKLFKFQHRIPKSEQKKVPCCPKCFAKLVLMAAL